MQKAVTLWASLAGLALLSVISLFVGVIELPPAALLRDPDALRLMAISRFPRTVSVILTGASLAIAGTIMQALTRNRFVEPMTAGTGQGAALGVLLVTLFTPAAPIAVRTGLAAVTAMITTLGFLAILRRLPPAQPLLIPLVGLIYGGIIGAGVVFVAYQADLLQYIDVWMNGEFSGVLRGRYEILWLAGAAALLTYVAADQFAIAGLGRTASINLGLRYERVVMLGLVSVAFVTAITVVTVGMIPFVGLVVPNIVSRAHGDNLRATLPLTALMGAILVLLSDILARLLRTPFEIPVGTVFGVIGAVLFLWLLYRRPTHVS